MSIFATIDNPQPSGEKPASKVKRGCVAALLSILLPGLGQIYNGQLLVGGLLAVTFLAFGSVGMIALRSGFRVAAAWVLVRILFQLAVAVHAAAVAVRRVKSGEIPRHTWISYSLGALILVATVVTYPGFPGRNLPVRAYKIVSESMNPTFFVGDRFVADMTYYNSHRLNRGDVVVFREPPGDALIVKRVIALEGDTIQGTSETTVLNGQTLSEPYAIRHDPAAPSDDAQTFGPIKIPSNQMFVMGDNRDDSYDSRYFGPLDVGRVAGKALYIYYSSRDARRIGRAIH
jgi:signal peptidase I